MSLSDLASLGSFVSGAAVLTSLVFLYFQLGQLNRQVRQAERNQQAAVRQGRSATRVQVALAIAEPEIASAMRAAESSPTEVQITQYIGLTRAVFANYEDVFYQHAEGLLDHVAFESWKRSALSGLASAPRRVAWKWTRASFGAEFQAFIDQLLAEAPVVPGATYNMSVHRWKADLAEELSAAAQAGR